MNVVKYGGNVIDHLNNTKHDDIVKHYINNQQPVIVTDTTKDWGSKQKLNLDEIVKVISYHILFCCVAIFRLKIYFTLYFKNFSF